MPGNEPPAREEVIPRRAWPASFIILAGAVGLWFAETYKPSLSNDLGLNGNKFVLQPGTYHLIMIASILCLVGGAIRLLVVLTSR